MGVLVVSSAGLAGSAAGQTSTPTVTKTLYAGPVDSGVLEIDGRLDEAAWATAPLGTGFVERVPTPGATPPVRTEVRTLVSDSTLYVGVTCFIRPGDAPPRALELQRDSFGVFSDEAVTLKIDVRHDTRTTIGFATNPAGVQLDYVAVENGQAFRREFDAIWEVRTEVRADRWTAEFEIPAVALGLPDRSPLGRRVVGLNVTRDHNARLATYDWSRLPPEFGPTAALFYGDLLGLDALGGGRPLSVIPYVLGGWEAERTQSASFPDGDLRFRAGGDLRLRIGEDLWAELTVLTDFAQVDLDDPTLNLERFALFFPERRPFFLSGVEFFEFGADGSTQLYFSRRIGLDEDANPIDLLGGVKSYGTLGEFRYGVLGAVTDATASQPGQSFTVVRGRQNFGAAGHIGAIGTLRTDVGLFTDDDVAEAPEVAAGVDGALRIFDQRLELSGFASFSARPEAPGEEPAFAGQARLRWQGYLVQPEIQVLAVEEDFDPAIGFVRRPDQIGTSVRLPLVLRTTKFGLQQITVAAETLVVRDFDEDLLITQKAGASVEVLLRSNFSFEFYIEASEDLVRETTEVAGIDIAPGRYRGPFMFLGISTPGGRNPTAFVGWSHNEAFFGGVADSIQGNVTARIGPNLRLFGAGNLVFIQFPDEELQTTFSLNGSATWTPTTRIQLDLVGQTNSVNEEATFLGRFRWRYLPGSDLFVVYREQVAYGGVETENERSLTVKVGYRYDALL